jgi:hypothetical protein
MLAGRQTGEVDIQHEESVLCVVMSRCLPFASVAMTGRFTSLVHMEIGDTIKGIRHGGWLGTVL